ncbi:hypothetical protein TPHV1_10265 [Treponema phagedenis]|uniref:Uncharacterized protein n=1 Tax=Treponema phagedenis TaxID=162 RepID=A0A0B7GSV8_TREPH|nr:hypothetical protein [Treponema phagedenis]CEM60597.1 hypothetical protein TPHV1_10265 [Treponema phagedenis]
MSEQREIYYIINNLAKQGMAIIMISSELPEVLGMSDKIMVVHEGKITGIVPAAEASQENYDTCNRRYSVIALTYRWI